LSLKPIILYMTEYKLRWLKTDNVCDYTEKKEQINTEP